METPCWCPSEGHQHGGRTITETSVLLLLVLLLKRNVISPEFRHMESNNSFSVKNYSGSKNLSNSSSFDLHESLAGPPF